MTTHQQDIDPLYFDLLNPYMELNPILKEITLNNNNNNNNNDNNKENQFTDHVIFDDNYLNLLQVYINK